MVSPVLSRTDKKNEAAKTIPPPRITPKGGGNGDL
jgi:hypothetical protein